MSVSIKTEHEIELMREAGHLLEKVHDGLIPYIKPGVSTKEIDRIGEQMIRDLGCIPNFLNYGGFPASFCISLNDEVVHGIPSEEKIIQEGNLVKIDAGLIYKGYHSDAARTYAVGEVSPQARKLMDVTRECFFEGTPSNSSCSSPWAESGRFAALFSAISPVRLSRGHSPLSAAP